MESRRTKTLRRDLSMSKDMRDSPRANLGVAANMFEWKDLNGTRSGDIAHGECSEVSAASGSEVHNATKPGENDANSHDNYRTS